MEYVIQFADGLRTGSGRLLLARMSMLNVTVVTKHVYLPPTTAESPLHTSFPVDKHDRLRDASTGSNRKALENFLLLEFQAVRAADAGCSENVALL